MKFLRKNWFKIIIVAVMAWLMSSFIDGRLAEKQYKRDIENLDIDIQRLEAVNDGKEDIIVDLRTARAEDKAAADKEIADMKENQKRALSKIGAERDEWKEKVENLPASEVIIETKIILIQRAEAGVAIEIWERPEGLLFSLDTAKTNLAILGDFSLVEKERDRWKADYNIAMDGNKKLKGIIAGDEFIFYCFDSINFSLREINKKQKKKFTLSEKRFKASYWKGVKTGVPIGGFIILLFWLALGK